MLKVLFIPNKYVSGKGNQKYYPYFFKRLQDELGDNEIELKYVFFSKLVRESILTQNDYWYNEENFNPNHTVLLETEANRIEQEYRFTFKQAFYPEMLQASDYILKNNLRAINLPEKVISNLNYLVPRFNYIEKLLIEENFDIIISDQSTDAEIEFARAICLKYNKIFLRIWPDFLGKRTIHQETKFCKDKIVEAVYDSNFSYEMAGNYLDDYLTNNRNPYPPANFYQEINSLKTRIKNILDNHSLLYLPVLFLTKLFRILKSIFYKQYYFIERIRKNLLNQKYEPNQNYIFWGFHLTTEATISLRGLPYLTQTSLIESISRVLPYNYYLYVREHPSWRDKFRIEHLQKLSKLPNVRVISTDVSIHTILKNSKGIITYNATTGIEALMHGKPVLSFSPNTYYPYHPATDYCTDLYELSAKLTKLVNTKVHLKDTIKYLHKMFKVSNDIPMEAETFFSQEDAKIKAKKLTRHLKSAFDICLQNKEPVTS